MNINDIQADAELDFFEVIELIDSMYNFNPTEFTNGNLINKVGENSGSCKIFSFAKLQNFTPEQTLACFGQFYQEVIDNPQQQNHQNIRNFMISGWKGIKFSSPALVLK